MNESDREEYIKVFNMGDTERLFKYLFNQTAEGVSLDTLQALYDLIELIYEQLTMYNSKIFYDYFRIGEYDKPNNMPKVKIKDIAMENATSLRNVFACLDRVRERMHCHDRGKSYKHVSKSIMEDKRIYKEKKEKFIKSMMGDL